MGDRSGHAPWGAGRVAFLARLETITGEIRKGHSLKTVFGRHRQALGITYNAFCRLVAQFAAEARPPAAPRARRSPAARSVTPAASADSPPLQGSQQQGSIHAGHADRPRGFNHDPLERPGDRQRLLGED